MRMKDPCQCLNYFQLFYVLDNGSADKYNIDILYSETDNPRDSAAANAIRPLYQHIIPECARAAYGKKGARRNCDGDYR